MEGLNHNGKVLTREEVLNVWRAATGDNKKHDWQKTRYLSTTITDKHGSRAKIEFYPDALNHRNNRFVINDLSSVYGDSGFEDSLKMIAGVAHSLEKSGVGFTIEAPKDFSDNEQIVDGVTSELTKLQENDQIAA